MPEILFLRLLTRRLQNLINGKNPERFNSPCDAVLAIIIATLTRSHRNRYEPLTALGRLSDADFAANLSKLCAAGLQFKAMRLLSNERGRRDS